MLYPKDQDSAYIFTFEEGFLFKIQYWSPCWYRISCINPITQ
jgi:hypothetical protein